MPVYNTSHSTPTSVEVLLFDETHCVNLLDSCNYIRLSKSHLANTIKSPTIQTNKQKTILPKREKTTTNTNETKENQTKTGGPLIGTLKRKSEREREREREREKERKKDR